MFVYRNLKESRLWDNKGQSPPENRKVKVKDNRKKSRKTIPRPTPTFFMSISVRAYITLYINDRTWRDAQRLISYGHFIAIAVS